MTSPRPPRPSATFPATVPYRDLPSRSAAQLCEVCGQPSERQRCGACDAVVLYLPKLASPVVVYYWWSQAYSHIGVGMELVDGRRKIARCVCQVPYARDVELVARTHAAFWAPTATIVSVEDFFEVLDETLYATPLDEQYAVRHRLESARRSAIELAEHACTRSHYGGMGTYLYGNEPAPSP